jgi:hypothetical protein
MKKGDHVRHESGWTGVLREGPETPAVTHIIVNKDVPEGDHTPSLRENLWIVAISSLKVIDA